MLLMQENWFIIVNILYEAVGHSSEMFEEKKYYKYTHILKT